MIPTFSADNSISGIIDQASRVFNNLSVKIPHFEMIFLGGLIICCLLVMVYLVKNFDKIRHTMLLMVKSLFEGGRRRSIISFLAEKGMGVEVVFDRNGKKYFMCIAKVIKVRGDTIVMEVLKDKGIKGVPKGSKIWCYYRPVWHFHMRTNNFQSFFLGAGTSKSGRKMVKIKMPVSTDDLTRRRFKRKRIKTQRTIIARIWRRSMANSGGDRFRYSPPSLEVNADYAVTKRDTERVFDVSERGIKLGAHKKLHKDMLDIGDEVLLEVKPFVKDSKEFKSFIFSGIIRNSGRRGQMITYGVEFMNVGVRVFGKVSDLVWEDIEDHVMGKEFLRAISQL